MPQGTLCNITPPHSPNSPKNSRNSNEDHDPGLLYKQALSPRWFVCLGEAKLEKLNLQSNSYIKNGEVHLFEEIIGDIFCRREECKTISLFNNNFDFASMFLYKNCEDLFREVRSELLYLHNAAKMRHTDLHTLADFHSTQDHLKARQNCVRMFMCLREYLSSLCVPKHSWIVTNALQDIERQLEGFRFFLKRLSDLPDYVLCHSAVTNGNKSTEASYHLYHGLLDVMWLHLTSLYLVEQCRRTALDELTPSQASEASTASQKSDSLDQHVMAIIADLVQLSVIRFEKTEARSLLIKSPFNCGCVAELWLMVTLFANKLHSKGMCENFASCLNKVMEQFLSSGGQNKKRKCRSLVQVVTHPCSNPFGFGLWLMKHIAMIHFASEELKSSEQMFNYTLLESIVKGLLSSDVSEAHMRIYLTFLEKILIKYWDPETKVIILLWEYFQKRLNSTFFVPGSSIDCIAVVSQSVAGMVKQVKSRLLSTSSCDNSFQMFLRIIGLYLQRVSALGQSQHWNQIRGRIYSKLSASKVNSLNETGLHHLVALFLTLAVTADLNEVSKKLQSLLASLENAELEVNSRRLVWMSHLSVCLLLAERGQDVTLSLEPLTKCLGQPQTDVALYRTFIDGIKDILDVGANLKVDYNIIIGPWISKYLNECSMNDSSRLLETLDLLLLKVQSQPIDHERFQSSLWQHLSPYLRQRVSEENSPQQLADLCLHLCLPSWEIGQEVVRLMLLNNITHISLVKRFMSQLVQNNEIVQMLKAIQPGSLESHEILIMKSWIKCSLLSTDFGSGELSRMTHYMLYLPFVSSVTMDLPSATDPLVHFIVNVSNKYKADQDICVRSGMRQLMSRVLLGLDKWVEPHVKQAKSPELVRRIYHVVGLIVQLMPTFIYMKGRPNTVLKGLLDVMLLPQSAYKQGYDPPLKATIAAEIHLYINGLEDLCVMQDGYINRSIQDLVRIYLPLVTNYSQCRLQECVQRCDNSVKLLLDTVCHSFIKRQTPNPLPLCSVGLKFLRAVVKLYSRDHTVMKLFIDQCLEYVCDVVMFCEDFHHTKTNAREVMVLIFESYCFGDELSALIIQKIDNLCAEYLPFFTKKLFGLLTEVMRYRPELIRKFLPKLLDHVKKVELKRGVNFDHSLRVHVEELEKSLKNIRMQ